ncbi:MAG: isoprenyl transferase [Bacillota bacterium]
MARNLLTGLTNLIGKRSPKDEAEQDRMLRQLDPGKIPRHVAIIMDGNGRWAQRRGLPRASGHRAGVEALRGIVRACVELKIEILTVYAFSTENWKRPRKEVDILMELLIEYLRKELAELHQEGVRIRPIGRWQELPQAAQAELVNSMHVTAENKRLLFNIALNYGGRLEIVEATKKIASLVKEGRLELASINETMFGEYLYTAGLPDPDILIRPSGEMRVSNFLLWQLAYTEFWITPTYWPDFGRLELLKAIVDYQNRHRRFGGL